MDNAIHIVLPETADRPGTRLLHTEQWVPAPPEVVFPFFSDPRNLETLTPPWLGFSVEDVPEGPMGEGVSIGYRLHLHGVPLRWRSRIIDWREGKSFSDVQERGPYALWHHTHRFIPSDGGTLLVDEVRFRLRGGALAMALLGPWVTRD